jgi:hypothetical protein
VRSRKFPSLEEAVKHLKDRGRLEFFGRAGSDYEYGVYKFHHTDGRSYYLDIYMDGMVVLKE